MMNNTNRMAPVSIQAPNRDRTTPHASFAYLPRLLFRKNFSSPPESRSTNTGELGRTDSGLRPRRVVGIVIGVLRIGMPPSFLSGMPNFCPAATPELVRTITWVFGSSDEMA